MSARSQNKEFSALRLFGIVLATIFAVESAVMGLLPWLLPEDVNTWLEALCDSTLLTVLSGPILWCLIVRPLRNWAILESNLSDAVINHAA